MHINEFCWVLKCMHNLYKYYFPFSVIVSTFFSKFIHLCMNAFISFVLFFFRELWWWNWLSWLSWLVQWWLSFDSVTLTSAWPSYYLCCQGDFLAIFVNILKNSWLVLNSVFYNVWYLEKNGVCFLWHIAVSLWHW